MKEISLEQIAMANRTVRAWKKTVTSRAVEDYITPESKVLDFGAGNKAVQTFILRDKGYNVTAYDFGNNAIKGIHDPDALKKKYDVIFASNVLNVQSSIDMFDITLNQIKEAMSQDTIFIANYTKNPRYLERMTGEKWGGKRVVDEILSQHFSVIERIYDSPDKPVLFMKI